MKTNTEGKQRRGFTLIEIVIDIAVFGILLLAILGISQQIHKVIGLAANKATAADIAAEVLETIHNVSYDNVGTDITYPTGPLPSTQIITRNNVRFTVKIVISYVDDPADGTAPTDTVPADYKKVEVRVCWDQLSCGQPVALTTFITPKTLEYANNAGAMFVSVIDSNGLPVTNATVQVTSTSPAVNVVSQSDTNGMVQLLNLPAATNVYHVVASKSGYSSDQTLSPSASNPNPSNPDTSIVVSQVTNVTLAIDRVSSLLVKTLDQASCSGLGSIQIHIVGQRLVGHSPDVPAYDKTFTSDAAGQFLISNLPWDHYALSVSTTSVDVTGITPPDTIQVNPGSSLTATVVLTAHQSTTARMIVRDTGTHSPISNADVILSDGGTYSQSLTTDQGVITQTSWDGGAGQSTVGDPTKYASLSGATDSTIPNVLTIGTTASNGSVSEDFTTTDARDTPNTTANWSTSPAQLRLADDAVVPNTYATSGQAQSATLNVQTGKITSVTLTATAQANGQTIDYYVSSDGSTFDQVTPGVAHTMSAPGSDLRWRVVLNTTDTAVTPVVTNIALAYTQLLRPVTDGTLTSSTFDSGSATNYSTMSWEPLSQPVAAGTSALRFQVASSGDTGTSNGPTVDASSNPSTSPLFTKNIGDATSTLFVAQSFVSGYNDSIISIDVKIAQHNFPTSTVTAFIYSDNAGSPGSNLSGSGQDITNVPVDSAGWETAWTTETFAPNTTLVSGQKYWLVLLVSGSNSSKYWTIVRSNTDATYASGTAKIGSDIGSLANLCATGCDLAFQIRMSGQVQTPTTPTDFYGPDGTSSTYYSTSGSSIASVISGHRYLRYKVFLHTDDPLYTPSLTSIRIIKNNACTPPGQVFFSPLPGDGTYTVDVNVAGYQHTTVPLNVVGNTTQYIDLTPES